MCVIGSKSVVALAVLAVSVLYLPQTKLAQFKGGLKIFARHGRYGYIDYPSFSNQDRTAILVAFGEPLELFCKNDSLPLSIKMFRFLPSPKSEEMPVKKWNSTTIRIYLENPERQQSIYNCEGPNPLKHSVDVVVLVESLPEITNFSCILYEERTLNCSWSSPNIVNNYTLFLEKNDFTTRYGNNHTVCGITNHGDNFCVLDLGDSISKSKSMFTMLMRACNPFGCMHSRFTMDGHSIVKLNPPERVQVMSQGSRSIALQWLVKVNGDIDVNHRVEYRCFENEPRVANTFNITTKGWIFQYVAANITLPCANTTYEVRIFVKSKTAIGDKYWSKPASIFFKTDMDTKPNDDPMCRYPVGSAKGMLNKTISKLKVDIKKQLLKLKERVKSLRNRADAPAPVQRR